ncbi:hypothetical protein FOL47_002982 [Perkinsus chesapeaki]|uniref:Uncharacterized protein n=1 Tax=Perkinsus chesapeaki TaxID=330153 RepID=A0A7J6MBF1_PERCH|nr:hypothetical protein FOL47_002982 [Perkinsus chesapeaki]
MELLNESTGNNAFEGALRSFMEGRLWEISVNQASPSWRWNMAASKRIGKSVEIEVGDVVLDEGRLRKVTPCMVGRFSLSSLMLPRETPIGKEIELGTLQGTDEIDERFVNEVWTDGLVEDEAEFFLATDARFRGKIRYRRLVAKPWDVNLTYELLPTRDVTPPKRNALLEFKLPAGSSGSIVHKALTGEGMKRL